MYLVIGPTAVVALLVLFLVGLLRMLLDIARIRGCGWWLMGAFWGILFQVAVAPVQWAMAKGHTIGKTVTYQMTAEAAPLEMEDIEAQRLTVKEMDGPSAPSGILLRQSGSQWPGQKDLSPTVLQPGCCRLSARNARRVPWLSWKCANSSSCAGL